jgi:hypothetical protein
MRERGYTFNGHVQGTPIWKINYVGTGEDNLDRQLSLGNPRDLPESYVNPVVIIIDQIPSRIENQSLAFKRTKTLLPDKREYDLCAGRIFPGRPLPQGFYEVPVVFCATQYDGIIASAEMINRNEGVKRVLIDIMDEECFPYLVNVNFTSEPPNESQGGDYKLLYRSELVQANGIGERNLLKLIERAEKQITDSF